jgi:hypothetical protein
MGKTKLLQEIQQICGKFEKSAGKQNFQEKIQISSGTRDIPEILKFSRKIKKSPGK